MCSTFMVLNVFHYYLFLVSWTVVRADVSALSKLLCLSVPVILLYFYLHHSFIHS